MTTMNELTFGIEIETVRQDRETVARAIQTVVGGDVSYVGRTYDAWTVTDARGRVWKSVRDSSIGTGLHAEVVSPVLTVDDIPEMQEVVRSIRRAGAKVDSDCGIHVHVGADRFDGRTLGNLTKIVYKQEALIHEALGVSSSRQSEYTRPIRSDVVHEINRLRPRSLEDLNRIWYGRRVETPSHYDGTRYHGLNLHNVWFRGTVEFRWFESTLHAGRVKAYVQFCLALAVKALNSRAASSDRREFVPESGRYDFRVFLLTLGLIGDEFKTARLHLLSRLSGDAAFRNGRESVSQSA